jgi:hypothetical protein
MCTLCILTAAGKLAGITSAGTFFALVLKPVRETGVRKTTRPSHSAPSKTKNHSRRVASTWPGKKNRT